MSLVRLGLLAAGCIIAWGCGQSSEKPEENSENNIPNLPFRFGTKEDYLKTPCGEGSFSTDLRAVMMGGQLKATAACANYAGTGKQGIFLWNPLKKEEPISLSTPSELPDQTVPSSNGELVVDFHGMPIASKSAALRIYGMQQSENPEPIEFPPIPSNQFKIPLTARGKPLPENVVLNMPKGIAVDEVGNKYVAVSDVYEGNKSDYPPGVIFKVNPQGKIDRFYQMVVGNTQYYNPVGLLIKGDQLIVKLAGGLDQFGRSISPAAILVLNRHTGEVLKSVDLGNRVVGLDGKIALTEDGKKAILSTADNSGTLLVIDLENGLLEKVVEIQNKQGKPIAEAGKKVFLSNLQIQGDNVYVANINNRTLYRLNWNTGKTEEALDLSSDALLSLPLSSPKRSEQEYAETLSEIFLQGGRVFVGRGSTLVGITLK